MTARRRRPRLLVALTSLGLALGLVTMPQQVAGAAPCDAPVVSPVACENTKPGNPESEWGITGAGSSSIQGFATDMSVDQGQTVGFKIDTPATSYSLDIYRMGFYGGAGARKVATVQPSRVTGSQPACRTDSNTGLVDCGNWTQNASWPVPADAVSGIYFAKLNRTDGTAGSSHIYFVVRDDDGRSDLLFQTSDTTWQAYNRYGGNSLYTGSPAGRAYKVSYNRPFTTRDYAAEDFVFNSEYPMVRFLESNGYDVSYFSGVDTDRRGAELLEHKVFLSVGHDEYWSGTQRTNVEAARAAGVHLAFFSGNEVFWKTRWENSIDGSGTSFRTLVSYKETHANAVIDPADPPTWTGTWRDPRFSPPADGGRPENALTGTIFKANCCKADMYVGAADGAMRFWRNTPVAGLTGSQTRKIGSEVIGYEWDEDADNGHRPPGLFRLSQTTATGDMLQNYGSSYASGSATHSMTMYRHSSGALVFGAGTIQWPWALDGTHDKGSAAPDAAAQQATVNLFADMGVQPTTLQSGLVTATASNDTAAPTSTITSPGTGQTVPVGSPVVISGTATDAGGGKVAGIEVSTDDGNTWRRADGRQSWTYTYTPTTSGTFTVRSRAVDDSGNLGTASARVTLTVGNGQPPSSSCPCSIWPDTAMPERTDSDSKAVELGTKFRASQNGFITGIRFYKQTATTGTHVGSLWNSAGTRLASVTFTGETASGWQQATFSSPVAVTANTTYVASYHAPNGKYGVSSNYFATAPTVRGPLTALQNGTDGGNGVYRYTTTPGAFPNSTYQAENYWVDVVFTTDGTTPTDTTKPTVTSRTPAAGATAVPMDTAVTATFSEPVTAASVKAELRTASGALVAANTAYSATTQTVTLTPSSPLAAGSQYTATVSGATDSAGNVMDPATWSFTTATGAGDTTKPTVTNRTPASGATGVSTGTTVTATFSEPVTSTSPVVELRTQAGALVAGSTSYSSAGQTVTFTPTGALADGAAYTVTVSGATDLAGNTMDPVSWSFTTAGAPGSCPCSIWPNTAVPDRTDSDKKAVEVGTKFRASRNGFITGIRFYKQTATTGTHVGSLWNSAGTRLASVTFTGESASGWQQAVFSSPVAITAGTTYVASYHAPNGRYGVSSSYFATAPTVRGPLTALQNGTDGGNGVYRYTTTAGAFPTSSFQAENYWVDVVFTTDGTTPTDTTKPTVTTRTPADGATNVPLSTTVSAAFSEPVTASTPQVAVRTDAGTQVPGTVAYTAASQTVTFTPASALAAATTYTVTVTGATDTVGNAMDPATWSFTTAAPAADTTKPTVTGRSPASGATGVATNSTVTATFSEAVDPATPVLDVKTAAGTTVTGSTSYTAATSTVTFTPAAALQPGTTYTATVSGARDAAGNVMDAATWSFTTAADAGACPCTIWPDTTIPATPAQSDSKATELGVKFRASQNGFVSGIRFYKGTGNTGTHVGSLWSAAGTRLASATFTNETATGWQQVSFPTPVAVTAGTTYVASYHAPAGRYAINSNYFASSATVRGPLTALQNGTDGGNGVYRYSTTAGTFPANTYQSSNYWVDVVFAPDSSPPADTTKPTVTARIPASGATGVPVSTTVSATFSEPVTNAALVLRDDAGATVTGTSSYTSGSRTLTFTPNAALASGKSYTATVSGAVDAAGNTMDATTWTFTTAAQSGACPCSIWPARSTPVTSSASDSSAVEVGLRFRAEQNGYITGVRFYKGTGNTGTHVGSLWSTNGTRLASVTFTGETASGWQQATFGAPVPVTAGTTYVASYHAPSGHYASDNGYFAAAPVNQGPLTALQDGPGTANGVYGYGGPGTFPTSTFSSTNYWVDVVFDTTAADTLAPTVVGRAPAPGAADVPTSSPVTVTFSEPVDAASVTMQLRAPGGTVVPAAVTYDATNLTATLRPNTALATSTTYTVQVSGAKDGSGNTMQSDSWTFSTAAPPPPPPDQGAGGSIAVVKSSSNPSSAYLAEILRAEGITQFTTVEASTLTATTMAAFDVVVLGDVPLTATQVTAIGDWVQAGGNLVAMKPDPRLAPLLGLTSASGTTDDAYLAVDQATSAGAGITPETIQYKGPADRYTLAGAQAVARLYSTATSATPYPAVTVRDVGANGGQAAAFTYDLAKSVIRQRQGNPAWAGQERDGRVVIRTDDMFFGGSSPDYVDFNKVQIPQADEQQRLLVNLMTVMERDRMPLPRFWYFPNMAKAVVIATGDDHARGGTAGRFDRYSAMSPAGCSVDDWQCLRFSSYVYPDAPLTPAQATSYTAQGFEVGVHVNNGCRDYTSRSDLEASYTTDLTSWRQRYGGIPSPDSNRIHCLVWSDWSSHTLVELGQNMRLDVNYYYWPQEWVKDRPGFMTGSGMPMRLTNTDGTLLDVYQATTQMTDESGQSYPFTPATLLDRALGPLGYYGAFTANMHTDTATTAQDDALLSEATSRGVPMVSGRQMLRWLDGRNASTYKNLNWTTDRLTFTLSPGTGARGLTAMLPTTGPGGRVLSSVTRGGSTVSFTKVTIKGQEYGMFGGAAGDYVAVYGTGQAAATTTATTSDVTSSAATVSWSTSTPATSVLSLGTSPQQLDTTVKTAGSSTQHQTELTGLDAGRTYFYRVTSTDAQGRRTVWPAEGTMPAMLTTAPPDSRNPSVSDVRVQPLPDGTARVTWTSDETTDGAVDLGTSASKMEIAAMSSGQTRQHTALLTGLRPGTTYLVRARSTDAAGNTGTQVVPTRFVASAPGVADHTGAQFMTGDAGAGIKVDRSADGAVTLKGRQTGAFTSRVMDAQQMVEWDRPTWTATVPAGASLRVSVRLGSTPEPDATWTSWQPLSGAGDRVVGHSRYLQYRLELTAAKGGATPTLTGIGFTHNGSLPQPDKEMP